MWSTRLVCSKKQCLGITIGYLNLILMMIFLFYQTPFDSFGFIVVILLVYDWGRGYCYFKTIRGELALFYHIGELYWLKQRWFVVNRPLFFRYAVVIHLLSKRNHQKRILFLMYDSLPYQDWRSLHYFLRQFYNG